VETIYLGIIQGLTEFLPISSSGHLYIFKKYLNLSGEVLPFFVFLHLGTLLSILIFLRKEITGVLFKTKILFQLCVITLITGAFGLLIDHFFTKFFENQSWIAFLLFLNGGMLLSVRKTSGCRNSESINLRDSILLGIMQGVSVFPGISRSGITIVTLLKRGFSPKDAFSLSFFMAIPAVLGAFLLKAKELFHSHLAISDAIGGFVAAMLVGLLALGVVKKTLLAKKFTFFGYYCIIISVLSLVLSRY
jgi:undecaprenyl-diphosphatase